MRGRMIEIDMWDLCVSLLFSNAISQIKRKTTDNVRSSKWSATASVVVRG
jgi:hypothetical protein